MHRDKHAEGPGWDPLNTDGDGRRDTSPRYDVNRTLVLSIIAVSTVAVVAIDFGTSAELIGSILFTVPLALCRWQRSERVLVATTVVASLSTIVAGLWGIERGPAPVLWDVAVNRGLLVASFVTFAIFIHLGMKNARRRVEDSAKIAVQSNDLIARNADLSALVAVGAQEADDRQRTAIMIAQSESRYRGLLEAAPDAMIVSDRHGQILLINAETQRLFGYERAELVGQTIDVLVPERFRGGHSGHRDAYTAHPRTRTMGEGRKLWGLRRDGSEFPVEISLSPIEMPDGILITTAIRDITSRLRGEEALRLSEERHRMAVEVAEMGTWSWKIAPDEISWSDEFRRIFGLPSDDVLTYDAITSHIHQDDRERLAAAVKATLDTGAPYDIEYRIIWPDGSVRWLAARGRVHRSADGTPIDMQGVIMDITERKQVQALRAHRDAEIRRAEELTRSNEDLQQFAYVAAHDLQEPLRMVASYTQLLSQRYTGRLDADADEFIAFAVDGARRMQMLIADLLAYCRVETAGKEMLEISSTDAFEEAVRNLDAAIAESDAVITHVALPLVVADRTQLVQLFQNLIGNAIKYRRPGRPEIRVSAQRGRPNEWIFSVCDNGIGIDPKYFDKIFLMFQRLHSREEFSGTGIGLTLCKKIAERHGGRIWVERNPGPGSTFHVALPERVMQ